MKKMIAVIMAVILCACSAPHDIDSSTNENLEILEGITKQVSDKDLKESQNLITDKMEFMKLEQRVPDKLPTEDEGMGVDVRFSDLRKLDLREEEEALELVTFDTETQWGTQLPSEFDPVKILEEGKNPGLGIRSLHEKGITGKGVNIGIIDQGLNLDHHEYKGKIKLYERLHDYDEHSTMHGPAVTSLAVGNTTGVAPDANIYYIACSFMDIDKDRNMTINLDYMAQAIHRMLDINAQLPEEDKISVISISRGFSREDTETKGSAAVYEAIEEAKKQGVFVITTSTYENYDFSLEGLGRIDGRNPDDTASYEARAFMKNDYGYMNHTNSLMVPMDDRTMAGFASEESYAYFGKGGFSWTCPWLAGMYALCLQESPDLSASQFVELALSTSVDQKSEDGIIVKNIIQPEALIKAVQKEK